MYSISETDNVFFQSDKRSQIGIIFDNGGNENAIVEKKLIQQSGGPRWITLEYRSNEEEEFQN